MTIGTLCSGIGGIDLGFEQAGFECKFVVGIDKSCQNILRRHFPNAPMLSDMTECGAHNLPKVDVLAGGTPCQGFSVAGLRGSLADDRSNLCLQFVRIANELDPGILVWENVCGCLSTKDNAFGCFLAALVGADTPLVPPRTIGRWNADKDGNEYFSWPNAGVVAGPKRTAAWRVLDSQYFGVAQRRERVFVVVDTIGGCSPQILFECEGVRRHSPPRREAGQSPAATLTGDASGGSSHGKKSGTDREGFLVVPELAKSLKTNSGGIDREDSHTIIAGTVSSKWAKGTGGPSGDDCQNLVTCFQSKDSGESSENVAPTLRALNFKDSHMNGGGQLAVAFHENQRGEISVNDTVGALNSGGGKPGQGYPAVAIPIQNATRGKDQNGLGIGDEGAPQFTLDSASQHAVAYRTSGNCGVMDQGDKTAALNTATDPNQNIVAFQSSQSGVRSGDVHATLDSNNGIRRHNGVASRTMVRRLTPMGCARLQAHPDDWAAWGLDANGKRVEQSDSQQYRQYGNGVTVNVLAWIARRIATHLRKELP